jgi:hypothetical protein
MPRLSAEEALHSRHLPQAVDPLGRNSPAGRTRFSWNSSLRAVAPGSLQDRSTLCRAQTANGTAAGTAAPIVECFRTVPSRCDRPELETARAVPGSAKTFVRIKWRVRYQRKQQAVRQSKELNKRVGNSLSAHLHKNLLRRFPYFFNSLTWLWKGAVTSTPVGSHRLSSEKAA